MELARPPTTTRFPPPAHHSALNVSVTSSNALSGLDPTDPS
jgi:hypothetical protein